MGSKTIRKEPPRRRGYRLNKKKFAGLLITIGCIAAALAGVTALADPGWGAWAAPSEINENAGAATAVLARTQSMDGLQGRLVVVDAGHGGLDPGTTGINGTREDVLNLAIAKRLKSELEDCGAKVIMTREDENAIAETKEADMAKRRRIIEQSASDIVISIHMNWFEDPEKSGPIVIFMPGSVEGEKLARAVQESMDTNLGTSGSARSEELWITESGSQPCILVECGYLSNAEEEAKLCREDYQIKVAWAICEGAAQYFESRDTKA
jgi:N-acetylmuramoyl-L-alanine amidase